MNPHSPSPSPDSELLSQIRIPLSAVIVGLFLVGALIGVVGGTPEYIGVTLPGALLMLAVAGASWLLASWRRIAGVWAVLIGLAVTVLLLRFWLGIDGALVLLVIPATLGLLLLGHRLGTVVVMGYTLLLGWLWATTWRRVLCMARVPCFWLAW